MLLRIVRALSLLSLSLPVFILSSLFIISNIIWELIADLRFNLKAQYMAVLAAAALPGLCLRKFITYLEADSHSPINPQFQPIMPAAKCTNLGRVYTIKNKFNSSNMRIKILIFSSKWQQRTQRPSKNTRIAIITMGKDLTPAESHLTIDLKQPVCWYLQL